MKKIGIVCALVDEAKNIIESISSVKEEKYLFAHFFSGAVNDIDITVLCCGIGGIYSDIATRILITKYKIDHVIILGSAGAISPQVKIGDAVIAKDIILYNTEQSFSSCTSLLEKAKAVCSSTVSADSFVIGRIATVDSFVNTSCIKEDIYESCQADCTEMESAYIAKVCTDYHIPFIAIRIISDLADDNAAASFKATIDSIAVNLKEITLRFLSQYT
ncbi:5'-methylthioadenosine/S-adenosylhomocysteine nucleosidase [Alkaliphilus peptidifermentans]|uniref:adenosylhomocysteine nucleosidase n=1 Tax=Alkaliphilus peptidifermentans DSM 18978 TaxID=1120976 RepID=A0A1G5K7W6_9FIRM|nr:5'-methylthioadenosine/S-adenosylhomocysteine nucleosidase [Alkaliphilus peptidifermentans]SCY96190.1 adenosylhomocysteine nucleosidase [Alkaliphilus peptidifermentans DSM 18978]